MSVKHTPESSTDSLLRIAYVVHTFDMGGLERCIAHLVNHLDPLRFSPVVTCLNRNGDAAGWIEKPDVPIIELHKRPQNDLGVIKRLADLLREQRVDVVHSHNWGTLVETALARRWARVPCHVHTEHGQGLHAHLRGLKRLLRAWATRWTLNRADAVVICAESVRHLVHGRSRFPVSRMRFIPNGVANPAAASMAVDGERIRSKLGLPGDAFVIGSLSRLVPVKDFGTAIEAVGLISARGRNAHLVLVGDGPEGDKLDARAAAADVADRVHLVGRQENVGDWLRMFDVYVNSSLSEAMSMGILEAMAAGLPVVATDVGDNALLVGGESPCGLIVPPSRPAALANALDSLLSDSARRAEMAENAQLRFQSNYSTEQMIARYSDLYLRFLSIRPPAVFSAAVEVGP